MIMEKSGPERSRSFYFAAFDSEIAKGNFYPGIPETCLCTDR